MITFIRNKTVGIERVDPDTLLAHGILGDYIYGLEIRVRLSISDLEIVSIEGKWHRATTPECSRAVPLIQGAVGLRVEEEGFVQKVNKIIGRKACRHFANILVECCEAAKQAVLVLEWQDKRDIHDRISLEEFIKRGIEETQVRRPKAAPSEKPPSSGTEVSDTARSTVRGPGSDDFIIDLHVHSSPASPCSSAPVDELIEEAKRVGLNGICLTDHNHVWDAADIGRLRQKHGFPVFRGNEVLTDQGDVLVFGFHRNIRGVVKLEELRKQVLQEGGFMIVAHPFRGFLTFGFGQVGLTPEKAMERALFKSVDAVEVLNSKVTEKENAFALEVARGLVLPATGGSDAHEVSEVGLFATRFSSPVGDDDALVEALKKGDYSAVAFRTP
ncbi:MAG: CehA/McbA family metallohydrolase [Deltaproteobacteria bacterium]|nr:CehA/McbA family metallohydrolase [Deltaproteobacteria bacterium]